MTADIEKWVCNNIVSKIFMVQNVVKPINCNVVKVSQCDRCQRVGPPLQVVRELQCIKVTIHSNS